MSSSNQEYDELEETLGITFGIGIDCEAQYRLFCLYNAHGGQEGAALEAASVACTTRTGASPCSQADTPPRS